MHIIPKLTLGVVLIFLAGYATARFFPAPGKLIGLP